SAKANIDGIVIYNIPQLLAPSGGTLSPLSGPLSTTFTYQVMYKHLDGTAPQSVTLIIDTNNSPNPVVSIPMTKLTNGSDFAAGVIYQATYRFNTGGVHNYRFEAQET